MRAIRVNRVLMIPRCFFEAPSETRAHEALSLKTGSSGLPSPGGSGLSRTWRELPRFITLFALLTLLHRNISYPVCFGRSGAATRAQRSEKVVGQPSSTKSSKKTRRPPPTQSECPSPTRSARVCRPSRLARTSMLSPPSTPSRSFSLKLRMQVHGYPVVSCATV